MPWFHHQSTASESEGEWQQEPKMKHVQHILVNKTNSTRLRAQCVLQKNNIFVSIDLALA